MVTGSDALIAIATPWVSVTRPQLTVNANGKPVATSFGPAPDGSLLALVTGLPTGKSSISVAL